MEAAGFLETVALICQMAVHLPKELPSDNSLNSYSDGTWFEYRNTVILEYLWFPSVSPGKCRENALIRPREFASKSFQVIIY
jgi:hypothetical protein